VSTDESAVIAHLGHFCRAFDEHDWNGLAGCLTDAVYTDYSSFRGETPSFVSSSEYAAKRRAALSHLVTSHALSDLEVSFEDERKLVATVRSAFAIHRRARDASDGRSFDSFGTYTFELVREGYAWKIRKITQHVVRNVGDPSLHGARLRR